jgi:hypothetical protein
MAVERERLVALVSRLMAGVYDSDADLDRDLTQYIAGVPHPQASDLIYFWNSEFDHEPSPEEVVDRALSYRPLAL